MNQTQQIIYIVDDDEVVCAQLRESLAELDVEVRVFSNGPDFLEVVKPDELCCVLLDMRMPKMDGIEVQNAFHDKGCNQPIIFVTAMDDVENAVRAMRAGALHYLLKPIRQTELLETVAKALEQAHQVVVSHAEATLAQQRYDRLTPRERDVIALLVEGKANKIMGLELGVSQRTVEIHRARVMEKMEANSLADLFRMSLYLKLDPPRLP
ncbi:MAG: response regulator [Pseudomonadales bacterium]|jgi:FixJ family two-component response regulator